MEEKGEIARGRTGRDFFLHGATQPANPWANPTTAYWCAVIEMESKDGDMKEEDFERKHYMEVGRTREHLKQGLQQ